MAEKAVIERVYGVDLKSGEYHCTASVAITDGAGGHDTHSIEAVAVNFGSLLWKSLFRAAIIDYADSVLSRTVDQVMFPDLTVL